MALFKISKGSKNNLPVTLTEGYCWYTFEDSKFYIDFKDENGVLTRKALNAENAETLTGISLDKLREEIDKKDLDTLNAAQLYTDNSVIQVKSSIVGQKTEFGGEIFNDTLTNIAIDSYTASMGTNNIAGMKAFQITSVTKTADNIGTYTLENVSVPQTEWDYNIVTNYFEKLGTVEIFALNEANPFAATINILDNVSFTDINNSIMCEVIDGQPTGDIYGTLIMESDQVNNWESNRSCIVDTDKGLTLSDVGRKFDVYKNGYILSVGDLYTIELSGHHTDCGVITNIEGNVVTVEGRVYETGTTLPNKAYFNVIDKPLCGTITPNCGGAFVTGWGNIAGRLGSFATGYANIAASRYSFASGQGNRVGVYSSASGIDNKAIGHAVLVSGMNNNVPGWYSLVSGTDNTILSNYNIVGGKGNAINSGTCNFVSGQENTLSGTNNTLIIGYSNLGITDSKHSIGVGSGLTIFKSENSAAFGQNHNIKNAKSAVALGYGNNINNHYSIAAGAWNTVNAQFATSIGRGNIVAAERGIILGNECKITDTAATSSVAIGYQAMPGATKSVCLGYNVRTSQEGQVALGRHNMVNDDAVLIVGNGASTSSWNNAFMVMNDGSAQLQTMGTTDNSVATKGYVDAQIDEKSTFTDVKSTNITIDNVNISGKTNSGNDTLIVGSKVNFTKTLTCSEAPTDDKHLVNKAYIDSIIKDIKGLSIDSIYNNSYDLEQYSIYLDANDPNYVGDKIPTIQFLQAAIDEAVKAISMKLEEIINKSENKTN